MARGIPQTIILKGQLMPYEEVVGGVAITPGMLAEKYYSSGDKCRPVTVRNSAGPLMVAIEDALQGKTIDDVYAIGDKIRLVKLDEEHTIYGLIHAGENVSAWDYAVQYGDGTLAKAAASFLANIVADSATLTSWTTLVAFSNGTVAIPANTLKVGDHVRIKGRVSFPSTNSTDTFVGTLKLGSTTLLATSAVDVANDDVWDFVFDLTVRTIGASGTFVGSGRWSLGVLGTATPREGVVNSTAFDTTAALSITVNGTMSVSNAANQAILRELTVEHIKAGSDSVAAAVPVGAIVGQFVAAYDNSAGLVPMRAIVEIAR